MSGWTRPQHFCTMLSRCQRLYSAYVADACQNMRCLVDKTTIAIHLCKNGFVPGYEV
jgi:hypothetical protein